MDSTTAVADPRGAPRGSARPGGRLAVDAQRLVGPRTGVARYLSALLAEWDRADLPFDEVRLLTPEPLLPDALPTSHRFHVEEVPAQGPRRAWGQFDLPRAAGRADVLFCPSYVGPLAYRGRYVVTIHDAAHEKVPQSFGKWSHYHRWLYRRSARGAALVLTDSASAQADLTVAYGLGSPRVRSVPMGVDPAVASATPDDERTARERHGVGDRRVVLFVGKFSRRRNVPTLIRAFATAQHGCREQWQLVLVGPNHLELPLEQLANECAVADHVSIPGFVSDRDLRALYRAAEIFVLPSDYEGTSLTVLEAMATKTAVITGAHSALSEIAGDAGYLIETMNEDRLAHALTALMRDASLREQLALRGTRRARSFSWAQTAAQTMTALADVARTEVSQWA